MSYNSEITRPISLAIIKNNNNQILVSPGYDEVKKEQFFRLLGGGIEFGETSLEALRREFKEELDTELSNCKLLGVKENIFSFNGLAGHEIVFIYEANFLDDNDYEKSEFSILDSKKEEKAVWLSLENFPDSIVYPDISAWL